jgi:hypothetical protein
MRQNAGAVQHALGIPLRNAIGVLNGAGLKSRPAVVPVFV